MELAVNINCFYVSVLRPLIAAIVIYIVVLIVNTTYIPVKPVLRVSYT